MKLLCSYRSLTNKILTASLSTGFGNGSLFLLAGGLIRISGGGWNII